MAHWPVWSLCAPARMFSIRLALATGAVAGALFVYFFVQCQEKWQIDDVLGVWPLHGLAGAWGDIACGIFGLEMFGGLGGVSLISQIIGTFVGCGFAAICGLIVYGGLKQIIGIRMEEEDEQRGADLAIHKIAANQKLASTAAILSRPGLSL